MIKDIPVAKIAIVKAFLTPKYLLKRGTKNNCAIKPTMPNRIKRNETCTAFKLSTLFVNGWNP